jgi:hypothetical protein
MSSASFPEGRATPRQRLGRLATMVVGGDAPPRYCLVTDYSEGGVRVNSNGQKIPNKFELRFLGDGHFKDGEYEVIWRNDPIVWCQVCRPGAELLKLLNPFSTPPNDVRLCCTARRTPLSFEIARIHG